MSFDPYQIDLKLRLGDVTSKTVANLGAGRCDSPISIQFLDLPCSRLINVEAWGPSFLTLTKMSFAAKITENHQMDILDWLAAASDRVVDVIVLLDVLEHFAEPTASLLIQECQRVARSRIAIWLPFGVCPQSDLEGNPMQKHLSAWDPADLRIAGFQVEVFKAFHGHLNPPCDAGWAVWKASVGLE